MSNEPSQSMNEAASLSIGALSRATGIPVETLRTWERRYGFPNPERNESGHRVYRQSSIGRIRLIDQALQAGNRAANVVKLSEDELKSLLGDVPPTVRLVPQRGGPSPVNEWVEAVKSFDGTRFQHLLTDSWMQMGPLAFLNERVHPFLYEIGAAWADCRIGVAHEHFASERLRDFLGGHWRPLADRANGPVVVCAALPGETHTLGLHMIALLCAVAGLRVLYIGADSPVDEIASTANGQRAIAVAISVSAVANRFVAREELEQIAARLDDGVELLVGGQGAPHGLPGCRSMDSLDELADWATKAVA